MIRLLKAAIPRPARSWLRVRQRELERLRYKMQGDFGALRRLNPINEDWGRGRGRPIDRYYIEHFLALHSSDIRGHVLEFGDDTYTRRFGGNRVTRRDVMHRTEGNPMATIVADLTSTHNLLSDTFDCIICTQVLHRIFDLRAAIKNLERILKPGGVVLVTDPGISQADMEEGVDYWRFTTLSFKRLFEQVFDAKNVEVRAYGNVLTAIAFLHGLAVEDLRGEEMEFFDSDYELSITLRAVKSQGAY